MSQEEENYITPIFPVDDEEDESILQQGGASSIGLKDVLNKHATSMLEMFQKGYSSMTTTLLPPIDKVLSYDSEGKVIEVKTIEDMQKNKIPKNLQNLPMLVIYLFMQKVAIAQLTEVTSPDNYDLNKHLALIEISVRLYVLSYLMIFSKNDFCVEKQQTALFDKYVNKKEIVNIHDYLVELKGSLTNAQKCIFNQVNSTNIIDLEILTNILTQYGVSYFKLGTSKLKLDITKVKDTQNTYFFDSMSEMLDFLIEKIPASATAPAAEGQVVAPAAESQVVAPAAVGQAVAPAAEGEVVAPAAEGEVVAPAAEGQVVAPAAEGQVVAQPEGEGEARPAAAPPAVVAQPEGEGEARPAEAAPAVVAQPEGEGAAVPAAEGEARPATGGTKKQRKLSHRRNTSHKIRKTK